MGVTSGKFTMQSINRIKYMSNVDNSCIFVLEDIQEGTMTNEQETIYANGANGVKIGSADRNKASRISAKNGAIVAGVMAAQVGSTVTTGTVTIPDYFDAQTVATGAITLAYKPKGTTGAEIKKLYVVQNDGTLGNGYVMDTTASATAFAYTSSTNKITVPTGITDGAKVVAIYDIEVANAQKITNAEDQFSTEGRLIAECYAKDICSGKSYEAVIYYPKAKAEGNFEFAFGSDFSVQDVTFEAMSGGCTSGSTKTLWDFFVYDEDDIVVNA